jgi:protein-disulfide isomerase
VNGRSAPAGRALRAPAGRALRAAFALLVVAGCGKAAADDPVIARLGGQAIRRSEVSAPAAFRLYVHEVQSYSVLEEETRRLVNERLLAEAASREGIAPAALLARVEADATPVPDGDVERYLAEHPEASSRSADPHARVRRYLEEHARIEHRLAFLAGLRERAGFEWLLAKPVPPRVAIAAPAAPARGPAAAPVTIVHLASFGSAESARSADKLAHLAAELPGRFRWLHVNQLRDHDEAGLHGAELAFLAQDAGRFWEAHDALFAHGGRLDASALAEAARAAGLADDALERADPDALRGRVEADLALVRQSGSLREPTLFVNGRYWSGLGSYAELRALVQEELTLAESAGTR